jgi:KaiC/GvpD/RAD55 family RecA-like ATPase
MGVLGCVLFTIETAADTLRQARERFGVAQPFYLPQHEVIFRAMCGLADEGRPVDVLTLVQRLTDTGNLQSVGGVVYISELANKTPSAANLEEYLDIVWGKYLARIASQTLRKAADQCHTAGVSPTVLADLEKRVADLKKAAAPKSDANVAPPHVKTCFDFIDAFHNSFFGQDCEEPGLPLPFAHENFPLRVRGGELTLVLGEKGVGKSTILGWVALHLLNRGMKLFIASMEMRPEHTLKIMASQLLGRNKFEDTPANHALTQSAFAWLHSRVVIYDFLGITDWRVLLDAKRYAAEFMGCNLFVTDSMMRLGIMDDDYAQQGQCVMEFASFCMATNSHEFLVNHLNKAHDKSAKQRSRGSQQLIDNANNVVSLQRNEKKGEKLAELWGKRKSDLAAGKFDPMKFDEQKAELEAGWDSKFVLHNQRLPGTRQNGSIYLWFHRESQQLRSEPSDPVGVNYLERWTKNAARDGAKEAKNT